jgi:formylglycine-generating enzyme required for sulfatase activity
MDYLSQRAGILIPRGVKVFTFPHRTFQEYLAACHLADYGYPAQVAELARAAPNRWREAALLAAARVAENAAWALWPLIETLCPAEPAAQATEEDAWGSLIAGQALAETADPARLTDADHAKQARVQRWLVHILKQGRLPAVERARGGDLLARLGDPRFAASARYLPAEPLLGFVEIPAGPFRMGSDPQRDGDARSEEQPQHDVTLPAFYIARYPTTVAQFRAFVEENKYRPCNPDCLTGVANHPVVKVTWHDALAYCNWLTGQLKDGPATQESLRDLLRDGKWRVTLPSEAEWEKTARGPSTGSGDGRIYPWGDRFDPDCANTSQTGLGRTSSVGTFPRDASPFGVLDMSGNVWEWTRSLWDEGFSDLKYKYPYRANDGRENLTAPDRMRRVLRGGSWRDIQSYTRCASRTWYDPDCWNGNYGFRVVVSPIRL